MTLENVDGYVFLFFLLLRLFFIAIEFETSKMWRISLSQNFEIWHTKTRKFSEDLAQNHNFWVLCHWKENNSRRLIQHYWVRVSNIQLTRTISIVVRRIKIGAHILRTILRRNAIKYSPIQLAQNVQPRQLMYFKDESHFTFIKHPISTAWLGLHFFCQP